MLTFTSKYDGGKAMSLMSEISEYGAWQMKGQADAQAVHHAKRAVLDWFSALYPGTRIDPCSQLLKAHHAELGFGRSSLPGCGTVAFAPTAAWITGSVSHAIEFDDIFRDAVYHPGCPTIAAALAVGEDQGVDGLTFLKSIIAGYEISTRIGAAIQPAHYRFFHTTGTVGCFGAAGAVAALAAPGNAGVMGHALSTSASFASGLQQAFRSDAMTKALHAGNAASVGVRSGLGAASGITGANAMLEGEVGFAAALVGETVDWKTVTQGLGEHYNITDMTQKNHGCCGHTFAAIDAAIALRGQGATIDNIAAIEVQTYQTAINVTGNHEPKTAFECKFSLPYVVCHAFGHGAVRLAAFDEQAMNDMQTRALMKKLTLTPAPDLTSTFPKQRAARVKVTLKDSRELMHFAPHRKGDPEAPLSDQDLNDKFLELVSPVLGDAQAKTLMNQIWSLDQLTLADLKLAQA